MQIKKVAIFANIERPGVSEVLKEMKLYFEEKNIATETIALKSDERDSKIRTPECDFAVSLGGDGTVLTCAGILNKSNIPLLAVNMGTFGYITETSVSEFKEVFEDYVSGKTDAVARMRLSTRVFRDGKIVFEGSALNDISITSASRSKSAKFNLSINGTLAAYLKGDGVIVATPTGSTAYNLSAGGPILEETLNNIIINPICSFTLGARPLVIDEKSKINVKIPQQLCKTTLSCDGHEAFVLNGEDIIEINKSDYSTKLVKNRKRNSIDILRDKLGWAGGFNA